MLLGHIRQFLHQGQSAAHPTGGPVETAPQFLQCHAEPIPQLPQQPPLLERAFRGGGAHQPPEQEGFLFGQIPAGGVDQVEAQGPEGPEPFETVHQDGTPGSLRHHHHRGLLADGCHRGRDRPLPEGIPAPQGLEPKVDLMKFQLHGKGSGDWGPA
jgi:hypothetical protein